ncbi:hypothetical protein ACEPAH_5415 [Sanghuangporus vaninii]
MPSTNSGEFCFHPKALAILEQCVRKLMDDGGNIGRDPAKLWSGAMFTNPSSGAESSLENTRTRVDEIQTLKSLSKNMNRLKESLDMFIENQCEELLPATRHHGLASLPNEILLHVFKQLLDLYDNQFIGSRMIIRDISLVSKRFRENVLAFAEVWTYLDLECCGNQALSLFLQRSRNRLLNVGFMCSAETVDVVRHALQSSNRWQSLYTSSEGEDSKHLSLLPSLSFPAVKTLKIYGHSKRSYPWISPGWTFPCAEDVTLEGTIPDPEEFRYDSVKTLTYLQLDPDSLFLSKLFNFLRPAISLYALYLDVRFDYDISNNPIVVELPNVKIFSISNWKSDFVPEYSDDEFHEWDMLPDYFSAITSAIKLPNVQDIRVELVFEGESFDIQRWLQLAFPDLRRSRSVTSLTFAIKQWEGTTNQVILGDFFEYFPSLQSLALDTRFCYGDVDLRGYWRPKRATLENLESLQMKLWDIVKESEQIYGTLRNIVELGAPLRKIDIRSPYTLDIETLEEIVPGADIYTTTLNSRE